MSSSSPSRMNIPLMLIGAILIFILGMLFKHASLVRIVAEHTPGGDVYVARSGAVLLSRGSSSSLQILYIYETGEIEFYCNVNQKSGPSRGGYVFRSLFSYTEIIISGCEVDSVEFYDFP